MSFLAEIQRRNVIRMAGLCLLGCWLVVQVVEALLPIFSTPDSVLKALVALLAIGLLLALGYSPFDTFVLAPGRTGAAAGKGAGSAARSPDHRSAPPAASPGVGEPGMCWDCCESSGHQTTLAREPGEVAITCYTDPVFP